MIGNSGTETEFLYKKLSLRPRITLAAMLTIALGYAVFFLSAPIAQADRSGREHRNLYLLALGIAGFGQAIYSRRGQTRRAKNGAVFWLALLLPGYAAFQLLPLPLSLLRLLSPARRELMDALAPLSLQPEFAPLSVAPSLTLEHFLLFTAYALVFFGIREAARADRGRLWLPVLPILVIGVWQAGWGVSQFFSGSAEAFAHGTYPIRNHFAGFLEMALPFTIAYGAAAFGKKGWGGPMSAAGAFRVGIGFAAAGLICAGILCSLSRMGLAASGCSLVLMAILALAGKFKARTRWAIVGLLILTLVAGLALLAPAQVILRFANITGEDRPHVWHDTLRLIAAYPLFGCGLGGYQPAFEKFKTSAFDLVQDYAHNDYLQYLAELGAAGFLIAGTLLAWIGVRAVRSSLLDPDPDARWLGLASTAALAAIVIHSTADFNLYVPANAILLAWICGLAAAPSAVK